MSKRRKGNRGIFMPAGSRYGEWTITSSPRKQRSNTEFVYLCRCACGVEQYITGYSLRSGLSSQCKRCAMKITHEKRKKYLKIGARYENYTVLKLAEGNRKRDLSYLCQCTCGARYVLPAYRLRQRATRYCNQCKHDALLTHGASKQSLFKTWQAMMDRCNNKHHRFYASYGGRGIQVCKRWHDPWNFFKDMGPRPKGKYSLDRKNNNGNYTPSNCRWATPQMQISNRRCSTKLKYKGKSKTVAAWARTVGIRASLIHQRLALGWSVHKALTQSVAARKARIS